jgi:hypothetical protein
MKNKEIEELITICRVFSEKDQMWLPAMKDLQSHDIDPMWVAALMYLLYDRYLSCIDDEKQEWFSKSVLNLFGMMRKDGYNYIDKISQESNK